MLRRLPPGSHGVERRGPPRAGPPHLGHDLARRRAHGDVRIDVGDLHGDAQVHARSLQPPRGGDRAVHGLPAGRLHRGGVRAGSSRGVSPRLGLQSLLRSRRPRDHREPGRRPLPARPHRRHPRRLLREGGRPRRPGRRHHGAREGRADAGRHDHRRRRRDGLHEQARGRHRRRDGARHDRGGVRRELRRHVGAPARREGGSQHPAPIRGALLPHHREDRGDVQVVPGARGPGLVRLFPRGGRRADGRSLRTDLRAVEGRRRARGFLLRRDHARLGSHGPVRREGDAPRADQHRDRRPQVLLRPGELHARSPAGRRRGAGAEELLRGRGAQLDWHSHRRRSGPRARALDHQRSPRRRHHGDEHRPTPHVPGQSRIPKDADRRVAGNGLSMPLSDALDDDRARREEVRAPRPACRARRLLS